MLGENVLLAKKHNKFVEFAKISSVLNCCHGNVGEDGSVQGVFKACNVAQSSAGVLSSALCMDKVFMKDVCKANGIKTPEYFVLRKDDDVKVAKHFPLVVKPANLGSSIGISVCKNDEEFDEAVELAFQFDTKVLAEKLVENLKEFNCACLFYKNEYVVSHVNEVTNKGEIYSFDDKYLSSGGKGEEADAMLSRKIKNLTEKVYKLFECQGIVRVDFLYDQVQKQLYVNEINSIPGSLAFYLFKDLTFKELVGALITQSEITFKQQQQLIKTFESNALESFEKVADMFVKK